MPSEEQAHQARSSLERITSELASASLHVEATVCAAEGVADEILQQVRAPGADLIVMRTHGRSGVPRGVVGSVAERVLAQSPVPVLLVRPGGREVSQVGTLLVPVDGSPGGAVALGAAAELAVTTTDPLACPDSQCEIGFATRVADDSCGL